MFSCRDVFHIIKFLRAIGWYNLLALSLKKSFVKLENSKLLASIKPVILILFFNSMHVTSFAETVA